MPKYRVMMMETRNVWTVVSAEHPTAAVEAARKAILEDEIEDCAPVRFDLRTVAPCDEDDD